MYTMAEEMCLPVDIDAQPLVQAAAALRPVIRSYQEEIEREQRLPHALVEQLHAAGFYRLLVGRDLGAVSIEGDVDAVGELLAALPPVRLEAAAT